jgi:hypothetical protein
VKEFLRIYDLDQQDRLGDEFDHRIYYVMRTHSGHASRVMTWRVMSRPIQGRHHALNWMDFEKSQEKNKRHKFFLVQVATMVPEIEED